MAELPLGGAAEKLHDAMFVDDDHGVRYGVEDRAKMTLARPQCLFEPLLLVDVEHDAAEARRLAVPAIDDGAQRADPMACIGIPVHPVLGVEIAAGLDRFLYGRGGPIAVLQIEQGKKEGVVDRLVRRNAEKLSRGIRPGQFPGGKFEIPSADAGSLDAAAHVLIERILAKKRSVNVDHKPP